MNKLLRRYTALSLLMISTHVAAADSNALQTTSHIAQTEFTQTTRERAASAASWGLTEQEWSRYEAIKKGERGLWTPNLDPLTTLGIEATTDAEREKYARLLAKKEFERVEKELKFQLAYDAAFKALYPNVQPFRSDYIPGESAVGQGRLLFFTRTNNCQGCDAVLSRLMDQGRPVDIYVVDSQGEDARIRDWAIKQKIDAEKVKSRQVTLNHDNGYWLEQANGKMPVVFQVDREGKWQVVHQYSR